MLQGCVFSALMRPLDIESKQQASTKATDSEEEEEEEDEYEALKK